MSKNKKNKSEVEFFYSLSYHTACLYEKNFLERLKEKE